MNTNEVNLEQAYSFQITTRHRGGRMVTRNIPCVTKDVKVEKTAKGRNRTLFVIQCTENGVTWKTECQASELHPAE